jgi:hypothetical protein
MKTASFKKKGTHFSRSPNFYSSNSQIVPSITRSANHSGGRCVSGILSYGNTTTLVQRLLGSNCKVPWRNSASPVAIDGYRDPNTIRCSLLCVSILETPSKDLKYYGVRSNRIEQYVWVAEWRVVRWQRGCRRMGLLRKRNAPSWWSC